MLYRFLMVILPSSVFFWLYYNMSVKACRVWDVAVEVFEFSLSSAWFDLAVNLLGCSLMQKRQVLNAFHVWIIFCTVNFPDCLQISFPPPDRNASQSCTWANPQHLLITQSAFDYQHLILLIPRQNKKVGYLCSWLNQHKHTKDNEFAFPCRTTLIEYFN